MVTWDFGGFRDSKETYSVSLHSREASCSRQSPSTLERKTKKDLEMCQKGSVATAAKCIPSAVRPGVHPHTCSPEAQEVHAHQDGQVYQLPPAEREKAIMAVPWKG